MLERTTVSIGPRMPALPGPISAMACPMPSSVIYCSIKLGAFFESLQEVAAFGKFDFEALRAKLRASSADPANRSQ